MFLRLARAHGFATLDGLRGIAALLVIACHVSLFLGGRGISSIYLAVDFFFLLSGFILAYAYDRPLETGLTTVKFLKLRTARLYAPYLLGTLAGFTAFILPHVFGQNADYSKHCFPFLLTASLILNMLLLPSPFRLVTNDDVFAFPLNGPSWSLFFEAAINAVFAAFHKVLRGRVLAVVLVISWIALLMLGLRRGTIESGWLFSQIPRTIPRVFFPFFFGVFLNRFWQSKRFTYRLPSWLVCTLFVSLLFVTVPVAVRVPFEMLSVTVLLPLILLLGANSESRLPRLREVYLTLGAASYPMYTLHYGMFHIGLSLEPYITHGRLQLGVPMITALFCIFMFAVSVAWLRWCDRQVIDFLKSKLLPKAKAAPVAPTIETALRSDTAA